MERQPCQLLLWRDESYLKPEKKISHPKEVTQTWVQSVSNKKSSEDTFKGFLNQIDDNLRRWIMGIEDIGNKKDAELADLFIQQSGVKKKLPAMLAQMGFKRNERQKFPQYGLYYSKIRKHIVWIIRNYKTKQSHENELKGLIAHTLLTGKSEQIAAILESRSSLVQKIQRVRNLLDALMWNQWKK